MFFNLKVYYPKARGIYAILKGTYSGQFMVFIKENIDEYVFLTLPDKKIQRVPADAFRRGMSNSIIEYIEKLPKKVYQVVEKEFLNINKTDGLCRAKENNKPNKRSISRA
jgi:hypothetical protein